MAVLVPGLLGVQTLFSRNPVSEERRGIEVIRHLEALKSSQGARSADSGKQKGVPADRASRRRHGTGLLELSDTRALARSRHLAVAADLSDGCIPGGTVLQGRAKRTVKRALSKLKEEPVQVT